VLPLPLPHLLLLLLPPPPRLVRQGLAKKVERSRKQLKEKKNRVRKIRGIKKNK
jgi:small subunit ribosomal protein S24e